MIFVLQIFQCSIQNFINGSRRSWDRGRGGGPDPLGHQLDLGQSGRLGKTANTWGSGRTSVDGVVGLKSILNPSSITTLQHFAGNKNSQKPPCQ
jgi:hypothetical protein